MHIIKTGKRETAEGIDLPNKKTLRTVRKKLTTNTWEC